MTDRELLKLIEQAKQEHWEELDLSGLYLISLPIELSHLTQLKHLRLGYNKTTRRRNYLTALPDWLGNLTNLQSLALRNNNLTALPELITRLPQLQGLFIQENPITDPSPEVLGNALTGFGLVDIPALRRYYAQLREAGTATFYEAKLLIIGEGGAGKTSLAQKLQTPTVALLPKQDSTEGIDIMTWQFKLPPNCPEDHYHVNIWDFGGQEVYFATHQFFLTKRSVYVLVTDTRQQHTDFYTWLQMQETFGADSPVLLLKNLNRKKGNRFTIDNLPQLRERFANLKEVIELDLDNVPREESWPHLVRELENRFLALEHVGKPRPRTWVAVRERLNQDIRDTMTRSQYLAICREEGIVREDDALQLSDYLHHLGDILHFQDDPVLNDLVILKPTWGLDAVYRVLDNDVIVINWGQFSWQDLRSLWHEERYDGHHHHLLRLMQNFQLCYPLPEKQDVFIAPQLLRPEVPTYLWDKQDNLQLRYRYPVFMPRGILSRAIVKLHQRIEDQSRVWLSGVVLNDGYARAELVELRGEGEIRIRVSGQNKRDLLMEVVRALDDLHRGFPKLRYEKLIPCHCLTCAPLSNPHFFSLEELLERLANRKDTIECRKPPYEAVAVRGLLDDVMPHMKPDLTDRDVIYHVYGDVYGDMFAKGFKQMNEGDHTTVGNIENSQNVAVGTKAQASGNPTQAVPPPAAPPMTEKKVSAKPVQSAWANGLFYLFVFVVVITGLGVLANSVTPTAFVLILIAGILFIPLIGALQLRQDKNLSEKNFLELMRLVIEQLPLLSKLFAKKS